MDKKIVFISWAPYCSRSDNIAREFGGKSYMVYFGFLGSNYFTICFKYLFQSINTLFVLLKYKPGIVFVMSPPIFACMPVILYKIIFNKVKFIIDAHTAAFTHERWAKKNKLNAFFVSRAEFVIVTNKTLGEIVRDKWQGQFEIITDVPIKYDDHSRSSNGIISIHENKRIITLVNTFAPDEPLLNFLDALYNMNDVQVFITGKIVNDFKKCVAEQPSHIQFTDFLSDNDYSNLLRKSDVICALTTRDNTMQRGAYEAIYLGKPVVTSDWPLLKDSFFKGTIHVNNSVDGIRQGVKEAILRLDELTQEARMLRDHKLKNWKQTKEHIMKILKAD